MRLHISYLRFNVNAIEFYTVTGDFDMKQTQESYQRLINNKSPKNKRKYI